MKLAILGLALLAACSVNHRSGDFACERSTDCAFGRICDDGLCVSILPVDAGVPRDAVGACPSQCTSCNPDARTCTIDCGVPGSACDAAIKCPAGWACEISCSTANACRSGIDCSDATGCTIACSGATSCRNVTCGTARCDISCTGINSCRTIDCVDACACDVTCDDAALCVDLQCKDVRCFSDTLNNGCSSEPRLCNTCN